MTDRAPKPTPLALGRVLLALLLAVCPVARSSATSPGVVPLPLPTAPVQEEEEHRSRQSPSETESEEAAVPRGDRRTPSPPAFGFLLPLTALTPAPVGSRLSRAAPTDPFHNGLGCPFRC